MKTNLSKFSLEKMRELVGMKVKYRDEMQTITRVEDYKDMFGELTGYKIFTTAKNDLGIHYPDYITHIAKGERLIVNLELPQEYMDDVKQAVEEKKRLEAGNEERINKLAKIQVKERITNRFKETDGKIEYRVFIDMHFSFHYTRSRVFLRVRHESGTIELPEELVEKDGLMQFREKITTQMTPKEISEFFNLYEQFDFYAPPQDEHLYLDGWSINYNIFDGQTDLWASYGCPHLDKNRKWWSFCKYTVNLLKSRLPAEDYETMLHTLKEYTGKHFYELIGNPKKNSVIEKLKKVFGSK